MIERLRRLDRLFHDTPIYFVTACAHERRNILAAAPVYRQLQQFAAHGCERGAWLGAFVLMPDHLHAFVALENRQGGSASQISGWVKSLKNTLSKALRESGVKSPHWQKGYFDHVLRSEESYAEKWDYTRQNPVRAGLVKQAEDWPYFAQPFALRWPQ